MATLVSLSVGAVLAGCSGDTSPKSPAASVHTNGPISAPGGQFLYDRKGRVVFLHGVNAVYKHPPFELYPSEGNPWNFSSADASLIAGLGFNVVRLGMTWEGLEPGTVGPNDPAICSLGTPRDPHQYNQQVVNAYLSRITQTVNLLGRYHIYTLLDMHQDVYSQAFGGEGAPPWAVCTNGLPARPALGRWSNAYGEPALDAAFSHFWTNDVVGNLQGEYDRVWRAVAAHFRNNKWVVGYDPMNEPFSNSLLRTVGEFPTDLQVECFYTGSGRPGRTTDGSQILTCPPSVPAKGVIPTLLSADPNHLIFAEPDIFQSHRQPNYVGPMNYPNLVLNFHDYCGFRSGVTGDPTNVDACASEELSAMIGRASQRPAQASIHQPGGPAWFMSEFGATTNTDLLSRMTRYSDQLLLGWSYWSWKYYSDPTGSSDEALVNSFGRLQPSASVLSRTYPQAIAGTPTSVSFDPQTAVFHLNYVPNTTVHAPTVVFVPVAMHYPMGYCTSVQGARVTSRANADHLELTNKSAPDGDVDVTVSPAPCGRGPGSLAAGRSVARRPALTR